MAQEKTKVYTVSEINSLIKAVLEERLPALLTVTGQISGWKRTLLFFCSLLPKMGHHENYH